ncbi:hypothetical protein NDU88_004703 [Pleurodeles waltl]|uniref:Uncharacterized protein n=1 Tax=Pleurodeles waltl TaxID=8319 RepID=A0AAV7UFY3_PLEWA|nr:hypothetical protein NDU88_004703 [Pleurodeles waltl]
MHGPMRACADYRNRITRQRVAETVIVIIKPAVDVEHVKDEYGAGKELVSFHHLLIIGNITFCEKTDEDVQRGFRYATPTRSALDKQTFNHSV